MSDEQNQPNTGAEEASAESQLPDELTLTKQRARMMGITFSNNISLETLKQKIEDHKAGVSNELPKSDDLGDDAPSNITAPPLQDPSVPKPVKQETLRQKLIRENMRLIRLRITNLDPKKKDVPGEIYTVANEYLGTVRKYVPFGEVTDEGYHVPYVIYKMLRAKKFLNIRTFKDRKNNNQIRVEQSWAKEFALEVLDPLTPEQLKQLGTAQLAAGGLT